MVTRHALIAALVLTACSSNNPIDKLDPRVTTSAALASFDSCDTLTKRLRDDLRNEAKTQLLQYLDENYFRGPIAYANAGTVGNAAAPNTDTSSSSPKEGVDYSGTNNQEAGVDEGDFVKTDGTHIFVLNGNQLIVIAVPTFGSLQQTATVQIEGYAIEMLYSGSTIVVFSQVYPQDISTTHPLYPFAMVPGGFRSTELTKLTFIDVSNQAAPLTTRELYVEGYYSTSRKIDTSIRMISYAYMNIWDVQFYPTFPDNYWQLTPNSPAEIAARRQAVYETIAKNDAIIANKPLSDFIPNIYTRVGNVITEDSFSSGDCTNFAVADDAVSRGVTSIVSFDVTQGGYDADHIISNQSTVYASTDTLVIAEPAQQWWWYYGQDPTLDDQTNLHRFDISQAGITRYTGSGRIDGDLWSQFNLSEQNGVIRVASMSNLWNRWWVENPPSVSSNIFALQGDSSLHVIGSLTDISPGEELYAARFDGNQAYLITARFIDPLWTVDLTDPTNPTLVSSLDVPGVATYVQPIDGSRLLSIGYAGDTTIDWGTTQVSLYNVADIASPLLDATLQFSLPGTGWSYSEAQYQHKAFQYWAPKGLLAIPVSGYGTTYYSALELLSVTTDGLASAGSIDHSAFFNSGSRYWTDPSIHRSIFMGDYVVAISDSAVTASHLPDLSLSASVQLPGNFSPYWFE